MPQVMARLNQYCSDEDLMATALAVSLELDRGVYTGGAMTVTSAGHPPPMRRTRSAAELLSIVPGPVLGIGGNPDYPEQKFDLGRDELIIMFTDGLFERPTETVDVSLNDSSTRSGRWSSTMTPQAEVRTSGFSVRGWSPTGCSRMQPMMLRSSGFSAACEEN